MSRVWQLVKLSEVCLGSRSRYSLVADEDVKKPTNQPNKQIRASKLLSPCMTERFVVVVVAVAAFGVIFDVLSHSQIL